MQPSQLAQIRLEHISLAASVFSSKPTQGTAAGTYYLLKDLSFQVGRGDRVAIVGASGAGKTSLLRLLNRLSEPTTGTIYFDNRPYPTIPVIQLRQQIVLVLQESKLLEMPVQEALEYPLQLRGLSKPVIQQRIAEWLERLQIPNAWLDRTELQLSVGQRQIVAIARALATEPAVVLLDEPNSALDIGRSHQVLGLLADICAERGLTVVMVNHQLELAQLFATRVLHLQEGGLIQDLPVDAMNWDTLKETLIQREIQQTSEWD